MSNGIWVLNIKIKLTVFYSREGKVMCPRYVAFWYDPRLSKEKIWIAGPYWSYRIIKF